MLAELSPELTVQVQRAAEIVQAPARICILTGAGISAESGIPTFRDKQVGLWEQYRAEDLASIDAFDRDPKLVWSWYQWRRELVHDTAPNPAHYAIADWQQSAEQHQQQITLITQNVDDLHEQAGSKTTHLHGHLWRNRCSQCDKPYGSQAGVVDKSALSFDSELIACPHCDGYIRPDIVWFGEMLPTQAWQIAEESAANCDVFISIGTSSLVYPAAGLAQLAKSNGAKVIEINPNPTPSSVVDITLAEKAGVVMPHLMKQASKK